MATKQTSSSRKAPSRSRTSTSSRKAPASRKPSSARKPAAQPSVFEGRGNELMGLAVIVLAVLMGIGLYAGGSTKFLSGLGSVATGLFGLLGYLVPVLLLGAGVLLVRGPVEHPAPKKGEPARQPFVTNARIAGVLLAVVAVLGALDLLLGQEPTATGLDKFADAGGYAGALVGGIAAVVGRWGALVVMLLLGVLAASLLTGRSVKQLGATAAAGAKPVAKGAGSWLSTLFRVSGTEATDDAPATDDHPVQDPEQPFVDQSAPQLFDQDEGAKAEKPKRQRKPKAPPVPVAEEQLAEPGDDPLRLDLGPAAAPTAWRLPPAKFLPLSQRQKIDTAAAQERGKRLEATLHDHGVDTTLVGMVVGPTVTRYELELGTGVKVAKLTNLNKDIALEMATPDVRILSPIPGRRAIGVEVPNEARQNVMLGDILASPEAKAAHHPLEVGVGRDIEGKAVLANLAKMPHVLIAGQTGAGKSSAINSIITSVLMRSTPDQVRMILIDPKRVELTQYNRIPHLLTQVVANPKKAANALNWAVKEMERRYDLLSRVGFRDMTGYNAAFDSGELQDRAQEGENLERLPFILIVVDELADLMMVAARDVEDAICRIAQMARAVGIHLVIATQRPSVNVITGLIKANVPARVAFRVSSATDSRVVLDEVGAERLVGRGDMLLKSGDSASGNRIQGAWVEEKEVSDIVGYWRRQAPDVEQYYVEGVDSDGGANSSDTSGGSMAGGGNGDDDELMAQAIEIVVRSGLGSTSMLQRKLKVGFTRAGRLMDLMEQRGVVGPSEGSKARAVLLTPDELDQMIENGEL